jgi:hypothetical protein
MTAVQPELTEQQPWKAVSERDYGWFGALMDEHYAGDDTNVRLLARGILTAYAGISVEDFEKSADRASFAPHSTRRSVAATWSARTHRWSSCSIT